MKMSSLTENRCTVMVKKIFRFTKLCILELDRKPFFHQRYFQHLVIEMLRFKIVSNISFNSPFRNKVIVPEGNRNNFEREQRLPQLSFEN